MTTETGPPKWPTFVDNTGRAWTVAITVADIKRLRPMVNLLEAFDGDLCSRLTDPVLLVDTLYLLVEEQAEAAGVSDIDFGRAMAGDAIEAAAAALLEAFVLFYPSPQERAALRELLTTIRATSQETSGDSSCAAAAHSGSILDPSHSGS